MNEIKIVIEGLSELTETIRSLAIVTWSGSGKENLKRDGGKASTSPVQTGTPAGTVPVQAFPTQPAPLQQNMAPQPGIPVQNIPVQQGNTQQQGAPVAQPSPGMPVQQVPTTAVPQTYTIEQLQVAAAGLTGSGKMPQVMGILQSFGIQAMTELRADQYGAFAAALREAGAQI